MKISGAVLILFFAVYTHCKTHGVTFRRQPSNQTVLIGQSGKLECYVKLKRPHAEISIIWSKDGFINDRSTMQKARIDSKTEGLGFVNFDHFTVEDDGDYNCQVMLVKSESAYINVLVPPKLDIVGASDGKIFTTPGRNARVTCIAMDGKPAPEIRWMFRGQDVTNQSRSTISEGTEEKLRTTTSVLEMEINEENNGNEIRCYTVEHLIMESVETNAIIDLMYPPETVKIREISAEHDLVAGEEMTFTCDVTGGNPTPTITWEIAGKEVTGEEEIVSSHGGMITNQLVRVMESTDKAITCVAGNKMQERVTDVFQRDVLYPPSSTELEPRDNTAVNEGSPWRLKCLVKGGNPQPTVRWLRKVGDGERLPITTGDDGRIEITGYDSARSYLTIIETKPEDNDVEFSCEVKISRTGYIKRLQRSPIVKYAPVSIDVLAFDKDKEILNEENVFATIADNSLYLLCAVQGGYPAPKFIWSRNDVTVTGGNILDWESSILGSNSDVAKLCDEKKRNYCKILKMDQVVAADNNARYKCEINHEIRTKLFKATRLKIYFPPSKLDLAFPDKIVAGQKNSFRCTSSPSLPKSTISWYVDDEQISSHINNKYLRVDGNGGYNTTSIFKFTPSAAHNSKNITCRIRTSVNGGGVVMNSEKIQVGSLNVEFKPIFRTGQFPAHVIAFEGQDVSVPVVVDANPAVSQYRWTTIAKYNTEKPLTNGAKLRWNETDGTLYMTSLTPHDNRIFQVRAENSHGSTSYNISIYVKYEAHIDRVTPKIVMLKESDAVVLKCKVRANPIESLEITWKRANGEILKKTKNSTENSFKIENVRVSDEGNFTCTAFNGIGDTHVETATLKIERKPRFDLAQTPKKFAITAYPGKRYGVPCVASGRPQVKFTWQDGHGRLIESSNDKYSIETQQISETSFKSLLFIDESKTRELLKTEDDSSRVFVCIASNLQGEDDFSISVVEIGPPDCPEDVQMGNASTTSLSVSWKPEFNGGLKQNIWLKINPPPLNGTLGRDWKKMNTTSCTNRRFVIGGLQPGTGYTVNIKSNNSRGDSKTKMLSSTTTENYAIRTAVPPPAFGDFQSLIWIVATVVGVLFVIGTVCLVFFCRKEKTIREQDEKKNVRMHSFPIIHPSFDSNPKSDEENGNEEARSKRQSRIESPVQSSTGNWKKTAAASGIGNFPEMRRTLSAHSFAIPASADPSAECSEMMPTRGEDLNAWERNRNVCDYLNSVRGFNTMRSYKSPALDGFYPKHQHLEQAFNYSMAPPNGGHSSQHSPPTMCVVDDGTNHAAVRQPLLRQQSDGHHSATSAGYVTSHDRIVPLVTQYRESKRSSFGPHGAQAARTTPNDDVMYDPTLITPTDNGLYVIGAGNENYHDNQDDGEPPLPPPPAALISRGWNQPQTRSSGGAGGHRMSCTEGSSSWQQQQQQQQQQHPQEQRWSMTHSRSTTSGGSEYSQDCRSHSVTSNSTASSTRALLSNVRGLKRDGVSPPLRFRDRARVPRDEEELETRREFFLRCVNNDLAEEEEEEGESGLDFLV